MTFSPMEQADDWPIYYEIESTASFFKGCCLQVVYHTCQTYKKAYVSASRGGMQLKDMAKCLNWEQ